MTRVQRKKIFHAARIRHLFWTLLLAGSLFLFSVFLPAMWNWPTTHGAHFTLHFLSVGQGDSELIQCGDVQTLIDGGPDRTVLQQLGRIMPFADRRIETVILSHPHSDHIFGLFAVLERYQVERLAVSEFVTETDLGVELLKLAHRRGVMVTTVKAGDSLLVGDCGALTVLWPDAAAAKKIVSTSNEQANDESLVLELQRAQSVNQVLAVFESDVGSAVESWLLAHHATQSTILLKVAHHGSRFSSTYDFIAALKPQYAMIEVGQNNYGQPAATVLNRLATLGAKVRRSDRNGTSSFSLDRGVVSLF